MSSTGDGPNNNRGVSGPGADAARLKVAAPDPGGEVRYVSSAELFAGAREVVIQYEHHRYRLKITSKGGMILNK